MRPPSNFAGFIRQSFDPRDRETYLEPTRLFLESRYGSPSNHPESQAEELADEETPPEPDPLGTTAYPMPAGDLTGDGLEDVLVEEFAASDNSKTMVGVRGTDGQELWRVEGPSFDWATTNIVGDLTGDDRDEILTVGNKFLEINQTEECGESVCVYDYSDRLMVTVEVRSGATGELLW
ncbi:MAG: FG-GAP repeat domain-containing protein, partial [Acidimicrobiia bacterium]